MAGKLMSRPTYGVLLHCYKNICNPSLIQRKYGRKQYNYDLDSLIEWNSDTTLAFGSPVKFTKTGKIRKGRKIPDKQLTNDLEALNAIAASISVTHNDDHVTDTTITKTCLTHGKGEKSVMETIPEYCFEDNIPEYDNTSHSLHALSSVSSSKHKKQMTEDGIFIPEIKPVPKYTSNTKVKKGKIPQSPSLKQNVNDFSLRQTLQSELSSYIISQSHRPESKQFSSNSERNFASLTATATSKSNLSSSQSELPIEPPESFNFITEFPIAFEDRKKVTEYLESSKLQMYKSDIEKLNLRTQPSVKTILSKTMPELNRFFLSRWREGLVKELGEEGFKLHQEATIKRGINFHANVMELLSGKPVSEIQIMPDNEGHWASLQSAMSLITDVHALEADVRHPFLIYRGVFDCIARYKDLLCVVDWKTSKKPRPLLKNTYDDPLQIAAYVGAVNASNASEDNAQKINHGVIVVAYPDGSPAHVHMMNHSQCEHYWQDWTERLYNYFQLLYSSKFG